jgi:hypothetical protein
MLVGVMMLVTTGVSYGVVHMIEPPSVLAGLVGDHAGMVVSAGPRSPVALPDVPWSVSEVVATVPDTAMLLATGVGLFLAAAGVRRGTWT